MERLLSVTWGPDVKEDVFQRWNQGFVFSSKEPLALVQFSGGPCAVLAPVQAYIIQKHLYDKERANIDDDSWKDCTDSTARELLISALTHILHQARSEQCKIVILKDKMLNHQDDHSPDLGGTPSRDHAHEGGVLKRKHPSPHSEPVKKENTASKEDFISPAAVESLMRRAADSNGRNRGVTTGCGKLTLDFLSSALSNVGQLQKTTPGLLSQAPSATSNLLSQIPPPNSSNSSQQTLPTTTPTVITAATTGSSSILGPAPRQGSRAPTEKSQIFHMSISVCSCADESSTVQCLNDNFRDFIGPFGVLLFLYSVILTKGVDQILEEREESEQPLIDPVYGHGSQNLINLLTVGNAVTNVFDLNKDLGGIKLRGIPRQSTVGFLTLLEALRYCEVGTFLKNPAYPVWLIGSETHLTVLFSLETGLTYFENSQSLAKREFSRFDLDGSGMIPSSKLGELLKNLELENDPDYVSYMVSKLDVDNSGIIIYNDFVKEFFPYQIEIEKPRVFTVYHYNGLHQLNGEVKFIKGNAVILGEVGSTSTEATLLNCLHTKWPTLVIHWEEEIEPKII